MAVEDGLASGFAVVGAEVEASDGGIGGLQVGGEFLGQAVGGGPFVGSEFTEGGHVPPGDDEGVAGTDGEFIAEGDAGAVGGEEAFGREMAEGTRIFHGELPEAKVDRGEGKRVYTRDTSGGEIAQLVEQWTENPCVIGSIPILATTFFAQGLFLNAEGEGEGLVGGGGFPRAAVEEREGRGAGLEGLEAEGVEAAGTDGGRVGGIGGFDEAQEGGIGLGDGPFIAGGGIADEFDGEGGAVGDFDGFTVSVLREDDIVARAAVATGEQAGGEHKGNQGPAFHGEPPLGLTGTVWAFRRPISATFAKFSFRWGDIAILSDKIVTWAGDGTI